MQHDIIYIWNLQYDTNKPINRITNIENRLVVAKGVGVGGRMEWEDEINRCKPLLIYREWINNKVLPYNRELSSISCNKP